MKAKNRKNCTRFRCDHKMESPPQTLRWFFHWNFVWIWWNYEVKKPQKPNRRSFDGQKNIWWIPLPTSTCCVKKKKNNGRKKLCALKFPSESNFTFKSVNWVDTKNETVIALCVFIANIQCKFVESGISNQPFAHHYKKLFWFSHDFADKKKQNKKVKTKNNEEKIKKKKLRKTIDIQLADRILFLFY